MRIPAVILTVLLTLFPLIQPGAADRGQGDVAFVVLGKTSNRRQLANAALHLLNYHFFAEIFLRKKGSITAARLFQPGNDKPVLFFTGKSPVLEVHGGRYNSEPGLDADYPDGKYVFSYKLSDGSRISQPVLIENNEKASRIPAAITIFLSQAGQSVLASVIDPDKDLKVTWSNFATGNSDVNGIVDDLIFVVTGDCHGKKIDHSGGPFGNGDFLTFAATDYVIPAARLEPGETFQLSVEHAEMDTSRYRGIPGIATYAATTFLDIKTTGKQSEQRIPCPARMPAMDGGQTDRPGRAR